MKRAQPPVLNCSKNFEDSIFDIAGPARSKVDAGENIKGGTAPTVRLFIDWIKSL